LDEEITVFAVRGIQQVGLPLFPSGVLSDRGLPYSYAAWIAGVVFSHELLSYRLVSLLSGLAAVVGVYMVARRLADKPAAVSAGLLLAIFPVHVAVSGWARFYALAVAAFIGSVALFLASQRRPRLRPWFVASVALSVLLHELCIVLVALPLLAMVTARDDREDAHHWTRTLLWCLVTVALVQLAVVGLHFLTPNQALNPWLYQTTAGSGARPRLFAAFAPVSLSSRATLVGLAGLLAVVYVVLLRVAKVPPIFLATSMLAALFFQLGVLAAAVLTAVLLRPSRTSSYLALGSIAGLASAAFWTVHTRLVTSAALTIELFRSLSVYSVSFPLDAAWFFVTSLPLTTSVLSGIALLTILGRSSHSGEQQIRVLSTLIVLGLVLLGALDVGLNSRYYLVFWPIVLMVGGYGISLMWRAGPSSAARGLLLRRAAAAMLVVGLAIEHRAFSRQNPVLVTGGTHQLGTVDRVDSEGWSGLLSAIPHNAVVISNDELASVYHFGRVDYWLTASDWDLARYALITDSGRYSEYAGARVVSTADDLWRVTHRGDGRPSVLVLFLTGRFEYHLYRQMAVELSRRDERAVIHEVPGLLVLYLPESESP